MAEMEAEGPTPRSGGASTAIPAPSAPRTHREGGGLNHMPRTAVMEAEWERTRTPRTAAAQAERGPPPADPSPGDAVPTALAGNLLLGGRIALISKNGVELRYANVAESDVTLENVRSFGTEWREWPRFEPSQDATLARLTFRGCNIKDLRVSSMDLGSEAASVWDGPAWGEDTPPNDDPPDDAAIAAPPRVVLGCRVSLISEDNIRYEGTLRSVVNSAAAIWDGKTMAANLILGGPVSLISKDNIRYEGTLLSFNMANSTITLGDVRSFGTEGREKLQPVAAPFVPPQGVIRPRLSFWGRDIKDLQMNGEEAGTGAAFAGEREDRPRGETEPAGASDRTPEEEDYQDPSAFGALEESDAVVAVALRNYEEFHGLAPGTVTDAAVLEASSAGILGWACALDSPPPRRPADQEQSRGGANGAGGDGSAPSKPVARGDEEEARQLRVALLQSVGVEADLGCEELSDDREDPSEEFNGVAGLATVYEYSDEEDEGEWSEEEEEEEQEYEEGEEEEEGEEQGIDGSVNRDELSNREGGVAALLLAAKDGKIKEKNLGTTHRPDKPGRAELKDDSKTKEENLNGKSTPDDNGVSCGDSTAEGKSGRLNRAEKAVIALKGALLWSRNVNQRQHRGQGRVDLTGSSKALPSTHNAMKILQ